MYFYNVYTVNNPHSTPIPTVHWPIISTPLFSATITLSKLSDLHSTFNSNWIYVVHASKLGSCRYCTAGVKLGVLVTWYLLQSESSFVLIEVWLHMLWKSSLPTIKVFTPKHFFLSPFRIVFQLSNFSLPSPRCSTACGWAHGLSRKESRTLYSEQSGQNARIIRKPISMQEKVSTLFRTNVRK